MIDIKEICEFASGTTQVEKDIDYIVHNVPICTVRLVKHMKKGVVMKYVVYNSMTLPNRSVDSHSVYNGFVPGI